MGLHWVVGQLRLLIYGAHGQRTESGGAQHLNQSSVAFLISPDCHSNISFVYNGVERVRKHCLAYHSVPLLGYSFTSLFKSPVLFPSQDPCLVFTGKVQAGRRAFPHPYQSMPLPTCCIFSLVFCTLDELSLFYTVCKKIISTSYSNPCPLTY